MANTNIKTEYEPKIEERRADYEKLAESFAVMWELETNRLGSCCDLGKLEFHLDGDDEHPLINGLHQHLQDLYRRIDFSELRTLRKFYTEMRLFGDQQDLDRERNYLKVTAEDKAR
jgi:hypothetical protein